MSNYYKGLSISEHFPSESRTWFAMIARCHNSSDPAYKHYGGRGIIVCDRWRESKANFMEDMGPKPGPEYSLDRKNNDGDYEPGNCRWATKLEQANNTRSNRLVHLPDGDFTMAEVCRKYKLPRKLVENRLNSAPEGAVLNRDFFTDKVVKGPLFTYEGKTMSLPEWAEEKELTHNALYIRLQEGWTLERALTTPLRKRKDKINYTDNTEVVIELSEKYKVSRKTIRRRLKRGLSVDDIHDEYTKKSEKIPCS